jgi:mRNA-degrading endonuclease YafQ of YafQ-DinJ toxin-antitoxin module
MRVALTERFQPDMREIDDTERAAVFEAMLGVPRALGRPHAHAGIGLRKLHVRGIWEARVGLGLRVVFTVEPDLLTFVRAGNHDDIRRFLRTI